MSTPNETGKFDPLEGGRREDGELYVKPTETRPPGTPRPVEKLTCPHCSHSQEPPYHETYYDEDEFPDILCQSCGAYFDAVVEVAISWRTMKKERFNE